MRLSRFVPLAAAVFVLAACSSSEDGAAPTPDQDAGVEAATEAAPEASAEAATEAATEAGEDAVNEPAVVPTAEEQEPNNGATDTEYNDLPLGTQVSGAIQDQGDPDIFRVPALPGKVYVATLTAQGASLQGNLTVMDTGRDGEPEGGDYIKLANATGTTATLAWLGMGEGGHFVIVRDKRNLSSATVGGADFKYQLIVEERPATQFEGGALDFALPMTGKLSGPGDLKLYPFDGTEGSDILVKFDASGDMDGRLMIFAKSTGSWIARNDNQSQTNIDPLIDAFLTESGAMWLVVENVDHEATALDYAITATMP